MLKREGKHPEHSGQEIAQRVLAIQAGFRNEKGRIDVFERVLRDHYEHLRKSDSESQEYIARSLNVLHDVLKQPERFDLQLLTNYITEIIRFVENVGLGFEFGKAFVDRIIPVYEQAGYPLTNLYLLRARLLPVDYEHTDREKAFIDAKVYAMEKNDPKGLVRVFLELTGHYTATGQFKKSILVCQECERIILSNSHLRRYYPALLAHFGIYYFTIFNAKKSRHYLLQAKEELEKDVIEQHKPGDPYSNKSVLGTVLHYLGRDAKKRGDLRSAMAYYIEGHRYKLSSEERGVDDLGADAFYHLRMAELLISASLFEQARDHLQKSQEIINNIVVVGTANERLRAAWADLYSREGNYERARTSLKAVAEDARQRKVYHLELSYLWKLFLLEIGHVQFHRAAFIVVRILKAGYNSLSLFRGFSILFIIMPKKFIHLFFKENNSPSSIEKCMCPIHFAGEYEEKQHQGWL